MESKKQRMIGFNIIVVILVTILGISFSVEHIIVDTVSQEGFSRPITNRLMDSVFENIGPDLSILDIADESLRNSESINQITQKYLEATVKSLSKGETNPPNVSIKNEVDNLAKETVTKLSGKVNKSILSLIESGMKSQSNKISNIFNEVFANYYTSFINDHTYLTPLIKIYSVLISNWFRIFCVCILVILTYLKYKKVKSMDILIKNVGLDFIIIGVLFSILNYLGKEIMTKITNQILGRFMNFENMFLKEMIIFLSLGLITLFIGMILGKKVKRTM